MKWFRRKKEESADRNPKWVDLDGHSLKEGDQVEVLRYGMGRSVVILDENGLAYRSLENGQVRSCWYMVDASTTHQKVKKIS